MPTHLKRICLVIDALWPDINFEVSQQYGESGLSQGLKSHHLSDLLSHGAAFMQKEADNRSSRAGDIPPDTSMS
jgi:hypothetical protein